MKNHMVSDKIEAIKDIILKEKYMVMVEDHALAVYESKTFAKTALYYWFGNNVA